MVLDEHTQRHPKTPLAEVIAVVSIYCSYLPRSRPEIDLDSCVRVTGFRIRRRGMLLITWDSMRTIDSRYLFCRVVCCECMVVCRSIYSGMATLLGYANIYRWRNLPMAIRFRVLARRVHLRTAGEGGPVYRWMR